MSNVIQFLESMGSNAAPNRFSTTQYAATLASLDIDDSQRQALLNRDHVALNNLLEGRSEMCCMVNIPNGDEFATPANIRS